VPAGPASKQAKQAESESVLVSQCAAHWNPAVRSRTEREREGVKRGREREQGRNETDGWLQAEARLALGFCFLSDCPAKVPRDTLVGLIVDLESGMSGVSVCVGVCICVCLSACLSVCICLSVSFYVCLSVCMSVCVILF
jgi:hypothetical protein